MPLVKFNCDGRWANPPGQGVVEVKAGVAIEVCGFIADNAIKWGKAELVKLEKAKPKAEKKPLPSPVIEADEKKAGPVAKEEKAPPKRTRKRKK